MAVAAAAAKAQVHPSPPPPARRNVAWLACTRLALAAVDAVFCLFLATMWLIFWGHATKEIGRLACGEGCAVVTAACKVIYVAAWVSVVPVLPLLLLVRMLAHSDVVIPVAEIEVMKEPAGETWYATAVRAMLCASPARAAPVALACLAFILLMPISDLVKGDSPVMGSHRERMGSVIYDVGALGLAMLNCFVSGPFITVKFWRVWRMARAWRKAQYAL